MTAFKKIVFATDFSESSDHAFGCVLSMAKCFKSRILILHVINELVDLRGFYVPHIAFDKLEEEMEAGARKMMDKFLQARMADYKDFASFVKPGVPCDEILNLVQEQGADLIIMGTHGRTGLDHVLFGSTAEKVVRKSPVPVMTIRCPQ